MMHVRVLIVTTMIVALSVAATGCGGGSSPHAAVTSSSDISAAAPSSPPVATTAGGASSPSTSAVTSVSTSPAPAPTPTVPADVPTTGPNLLHAGEKPPVMPVLATEHSGTGAVAFAKFFMQTIDWGYATTSSKYMRHYYLSSCAFCVAGSNALDGAVEKGNHFIGDRFLNIRSRQILQPSTPNAEVVVRATFDITAVEVVSKTGAPVDATPPAQNYVDDVSLVWKTDHWIVSNLAPES